MLTKKLRNMLGGLALLALTAVPKPAKADFYDGCRGPSAAQVHYTATASGKGLEHTLAGKYFGDDLFAVGAVNSDSSSITGEFIGFGYLVEQLSRVKALPVVGYSLSGDGKQGTAVGVAQATIFLDEDGIFLADPHYAITIPAHGHDVHTPQHHFGLTASVGNERIRAGPEIVYTLSEQLKVTGLIRYDLDAEKHSNWLEFGLSSDGAVQFQFRGNF